MATGVATTTNQGPAVDRTVKKNRHHSKIQLKGKLPVTSEAMASSFSSTQQAMPARIARVSPAPAHTKKEAIKKDSSVEEQSKHQPFARSNSGKLALGPWTGPFGSGSMTEEGAPILYLDRSGSAHTDLNDCLEPAAEDNKDEEVDAKDFHHKLLSRLAEYLTQNFLVTTPGSALKGYEQEAMRMRSKPAMKGNILHRPSAKRGYAKNRVVGKINQPRRN